MNQPNHNAYRGDASVEASSESDRLAELRHYPILNTPPDEAFDRITTLAVRLFSVPVALIGFVGCDRIRFIAHQGLDPQHTDRAPLWDAALQSDDIYTVTDTRQLPACLANPWITEELGMRFYAAAPLKTPDGYSLGVLCLLDEHPRTLAADDRATLRDLAAITMDALDQRRVTQPAQPTPDSLLPQLQALVMNMPGMVYRYYPQTGPRPHRFTFVSPQARDLLELAPAAILADADTVIDLIHPEDVDTFEASLTHAIECFRPWSWQGRIITPSGRLKWIQGRSQAQRTLEGEAWDGLLVDISDRKQAEATLRQEFQRLSALIALQQDVAMQSPHLDAVMAVITERAQQLTHADGAVVELEDGNHLVYRAATGLAQPHIGLRLDIAHSLSGQCLTNGTLLQCDDAETDPRVDRAACRRMGLRSMVVVPLIYQANRMGILKVFSGSPSAFKESDIQTLQIMAGFLAASLHLASEFEAKNTLLQDLQASESRYRSVISALSEGVVVVQADGTITACNASAATILGIQPEDVIDRNLAQLGLQVIAADGSPRSFDDYSIVKTFRTGHPNTNVVNGILRPDGSTVWVSSNTQPLSHPGDSRPYAVVVSFTDITELRHSEIATLKRRAQRERLLQPDHPTDSAKFRSRRHSQHHRDRSASVSSSRSGADLPPLSGRYWQRHRRRYCC
ncbi:hypothetical protein XM38_007260 [Halomicronema hongdechloris C2206]|uniref:Uncharacterized protein n=1 Tax=Halomicronema hongdechloris C2206 TaxID=1641165 RepID=A0A1Z3HI47_9CYAN|nr:GAF domain-containing protein [Halomicronema hongdechloris]ASC69797.1 hypothetical protein XM38_007260 [Halomicronema hongdechloris C2206]